MEPSTQTTVNKDLLGFSQTQQNIQKLPSEAPRSVALDLLQKSYAPKTEGRFSVEAYVASVFKSPTAYKPVEVTPEFTNINTQTLAAKCCMGDSIKTVTTCWSSRQMTSLMEWRNPAEDEAPSLFRSFINIAKKAITEACLPILTVTAAVEAIAYKALSVATKLFSQSTDKPQEKTNISPYQQSAQFTIMWTITSLWSNLRAQPLATTEEQAASLFRGLLCL